MAYSDNNPERRNLTVLSVVIIIYYLANGRFDKTDGVSFPLIKLHFNNPEMLAYIVWFTLCWFLFKYIVAGTLLHGLDLSNDNRPKVKIYSRYIARQLRKLNKDEYVNWDFPIELYIDEDKWHLEGQGIHLTLTGFSGYLMRQAYLINIITKHKITTDYYTPFLLFVSAVGLGIYNNVPVI